MRVKELVLDGFKSYATRTVISGWDASFNCITGLNGSGKSNILDAICFVLGITSTATMRAQNQQELIYKRGQAGITRASVSIVFDNGDKERSPPGFEEFPTLSVTRQVAVGGTSKYLINGHRATQADVQKLFQSVQLNVNNPNFLILQGQVTKVLNMRPTEFLSLIEEAAGTRMYETRREVAIREIAKKDSKLNEVAALLREEIEPKLAKLRAEKRDFLDYQSTVTALERAQKLIGAYDFCQLLEKQQHVEGSFESKQALAQDLKGSIVSLESEVDTLQNSLLALQRERSDRDAQGAFGQLEQEQQQAAEDLARVQTQIELKADSKREEESKVQTSKQQLDESSVKLAAFDSQVAEFRATFGALETSLAAAREAARNKRDLLGSLQTGLSTSSSQRETGYASEAKRARQQTAEAETRLHRAQQRLNELPQHSAADLQQAEREQHSLEAKVKTMAEALDKSAPGSGTSGSAEGSELAALKDHEATLNRNKERVARDLDHVRRAVPQLEFHVPGFGDAIKGVVGQLFKVKSEYSEQAPALLKAAGGSLFNVVVDTDVSAQKILGSGLRRHVNVMPLNRLQPFVYSSDKVAAAKAVAEPGAVQLALDLVEYEAPVAKAMEMVFGAMMVCKDAATAKRVTFGGPRLKSITLDGVIFDPRGTLQGGDDNRGGMLQNVLKHGELKRQLVALEDEYVGVRQQLDAAEGVSREQAEQRRQHELKQHEHRLLAEQLTSGPAAKVLAAARAADSTREQLQAEIASASAAAETARQALEQADKDAAEFKTNKEAKLAELRAETQQLAARESELAAQVAEQRARNDSVQGELDALQSTQAVARDRVDEATAAIAELERELGALNAAQQQQQAEATRLERDVQQARQRQREMDGELRQAEEKAEQSRRTLVDTKLQAQAIEHELANHSEQVAKIRGGIRALEQRLPWLQSDRALLGVENTPYDFRGANMAQCRQIESVESKRLSTLKNKVNESVMTMLDTVEAKEVELKGMINIIKRDRRKIEETLASINEKKDEALRKTFAKVSDDLGNVFGDLLPGGSAKLELVDQADITKGLAVRVRLGAVWKEGLAELSGGQRSLVALSLILALLQFRPAPMYILDEVDAALDLHHTQNIGHIIKTRFGDSQFIVVSLKDGMFTNANRIFQTKFEEGKSKVIVKQ